MTGNGADQKALLNGDKTFLSCPYEENATISVRGITSFL